MGTETQRGESDAPAEDMVLWEHPHRGNLIRFAIRTYKGRRFAELRAMYPADDGWKYGNKGCVMPMEQIGALGRALVAHDAAIDADGQSDGS